MDRDLNLLSEPLLEHTYDLKQMCHVSLPARFEQLQLMLVLGSSIRMYSSSGWVLLLPLKGGLTYDRNWYFQFPVVHISISTRSRDSWYSPQ